MAGLPVRYAVAQTELDHPDFPPKLLVEDAVAQGAPHGGGRSEGAACPIVQCAQQAPGSPLLQWMEANAWEPDGKGGTDWTAFGSEYDDRVAPHSAVGASESLDAHQFFGACHKIWYRYSAEVDHVGYVYDTANAKDAPVYKEPSGDCTGSLIEKAEYFHPVREAYRALVYGSH
jgi:hypothetical protein